MVKISMIGLDLAKNVFQIHGIDAAGTVVLRRQVRRGQVEKFFAQLPPTVVGMEACGGAHHWARLFQKLGHEVRIMPPAYVKPYVKRNKNDGRDAEGVCEALTRPTMRFVPVKSLDSQAVLVLHRTRRLLVRQRTMSANALRSALAEFGIVAAQGPKGLHWLVQVADDPASAIPEMARMPLQVLARQWERQNAEICKLEGQIVRAAKTDEVACRLMAIPGLGPLGATAILAAVSDARMFKTAREPASFRTSQRTQNVPLKCSNATSFQCLIVATLFGLSSASRAEIQKIRQSASMSDFSVSTRFKKSTTLRCSSGRT